MTTDDLRVRVTVAGVPAGAALAAGGLWLGGPEAGLGVVAGAGLGLGNFWWLARGAAAVAGGARPVMAWHALAAARLLALLGLLIVLFASGLVHPVAVVAGLVVIPAAVVVEGLRRAAREDDAH